MDTHDSGTAVTQSRIHHVKASLETVQWGAFDAGTKPICRVASGDIVEIECLCHHAGDAAELLMDDAIRAIYDGIPEETRAPGVHIITGPIFVEGAMPGDTLECRVLDMRPRLNYGVNFAGSWGLLHEEFGRKEHVIVYEADIPAGVLRPLFQYEYDSPEKGIPGRYTTVTPRSASPRCRGSPCR
ncbi:MAG: acetamidase/formamidase family protein [Geminicoccaceae bacterium]|nr:acetamidase/formamidase family protein [Geminicoccaceae bacterium]